MADQPFFETGLLLAGNVDPNDIRRQISRWTRSGKIHQLRRGLYTLAPPHNRVTPHPFLLANALVPGFYVSGTSALASYGLIPEYVLRTFSVTLLAHRNGKVVLSFNILLPACSSAINRLKL